MSDNNNKASPARPEAPVPVPGKLLDRNSLLRILVIKLRHFGDVLLITPLLNTLKVNYSHAWIDVLVYDGTEAMLTGNNTVYSAYRVDRMLKSRDIKTFYRGEKQLWNELNTGHYDLIINLSDQWRAAFYCRLLKPSFSLGFRYPRRDNALWRFCHSVLVDTGLQPVQHQVINNLSILEPLRLPEIRTDVTMAYRQIDADRVDLLCREKSLKEYVLVQPTARWAFKNWSAGAYSELINHLTRHGETVVLTGGRSVQECATGESILRKCRQPGNVVNLIGKLDIPEVAVLIDRAKLFIGVDSAPMHMAAALKTPSVVLFGPSNLRQWHPWQAPHTLIWAGDYRPLPHPNDVDTDTPERYLDAIPAKDVIAAVDRRLSASP